jgi:hypothetical protein
MSKIEGHEKSVLSHKKTQRQLHGPTKAKGITGSVLLSFIPLKIIANQ